MKSFRIIAALAMGSAVAANAQTVEQFDRYQVPATVSHEAAAELATIYRGRAQRPAPQRPASDADWDRQAAQFETFFVPRARQVADQLGVTAVADTIGSVPVLRIRPPHYKPNGNLLIYVHGGSYTVFSARSALIAPSLVAAAGGYETISVDYTLAPHGNWQSVTDQVLSVWQGVLAGGVNPKRIGLYGDSAGGGLVAGAVLKMRDQKLPLPGALWLMSPLSDITDAGDTKTTLSGADPILDGVSSAWSAAVYAPVADQRNPYVSPVYGDYAKPFPPTLIQAGTRERLLSDAVREYQAIRSGGHEAVLDVYEGMPHLFQSQMPTAPESRTAIARAVAFFRTNLRTH